MSTGTTVEDNEPNTPAPGQVPAANFQLILEAVAGSAIGNGGGDYTLEITCTDETSGAPDPTMSIGPLNQQFRAADGWALAGAAGNFTKTETFNIPVPAGVVGHTFHYTGRLVDAAKNVVSFKDGNQFILV